jgi:recombination protein RecA
MIELTEILDAIGDEDGAQLLGSDGMAIKIKGVIPSGVYGIDSAIGRGGIPLGRLTLIRGSEGCLRGDVKVSLNRCGKGFECTIEHLVTMFNGGSSSCRKWDLNRKTKIRALKDNGDIGLIEVKNAWFAGNKDVFEIVTECGYKIQATGEHKFLTTWGWKKLSDLVVGDSVYVERNKRPLKTKSKEKNKYKTKALKKHPYAAPKTETGYRVPYHRLVYEAFVNGISVGDFVSRVKCGDIGGLKFLDPAEFIIHHKDRNSLNNSLSNLQKVTKSEHFDIHRFKCVKNLSIVPDTSKIVSIRSLGVEKVYDIETEYPNNYLANGIVVHNSGKTSLALSIVSECQKQGGVAIYIDVEYKLDPEYAQKIGVDTSKLIIVQPSHLERVFSIIDNVIAKVSAMRKKAKSSFPVVVVLDSMNAAITKAELKGEWEDVHVSPQARVYSRLLPKLIPNVSKEDVALVFISQERSKIGVQYGDSSSTAGGKAPPFYASLIIKVAPVGSEKSGDSKIANKVRIECVKNQIAPPFKKADCVVVYGSGFDNERSILSCGFDRGIVTRKGAFYKFDGNTIGQGASAAADELRSNSDLKKKILSELKKEK